MSARILLVARIYETRHKMNRRDIDELYPHVDNLWRNDHIHDTKKYKMEVLQASPRVFHDQYIISY